MVQALGGKVDSIALLSCIFVHDPNAFGLSVVGPHMENLHTQPFGEGDQSRARRIQGGFFLGQHFLGPIHNFVSNESGLADQHGPNQLFLRSDSHCLQINSAALPQAFQRRDYIVKVAWNLITVPWTHFDGVG